MSKGKSSGGCLKNLIITVLVVSAVAFIKDGGLSDLFSSSSDGSSVGETVSQTQTFLPSQLENIDEALRENVYLDFIGGGYCEEFCGDVQINAIFVTDDSSKWDSSSEEAVKAEMETVMARMKEAALGAGVTLDLSVRYHAADLSGQNIKDGVITTNWRNTALNSAGLGDFLTAQLSLENSQGVSSAPIVFIFNTNGRATASHQESGKSSTESIVLYSEEISALFHEMCHLYGAKDFYYPNEVKALADEYLPDSIMNSGDTVDPLTAFIIGWTDTLSASATSFLRETSHITNEYLDEEHEVETFTGYAEDYEYSGGSYTGYLKDGWPDGEGTLKKSDGTYYSGTWEYGQFLQGECAVHYTNGDYYSGGLKDGVLDGYGVYVFSSGTREEGYYVNGKGNGQFVIYYESGAVFRGTKENGVITGYGELTYANGNYYSGNWENGLPNGYGEMTYTNGDVYKGDWKDNVRHGYGTYTWASGSQKSGNWSNGEFAG